MSRSNVYIQAGNDHRDVSIGGRGTSNGGYAVINTDNAHHHDVSIRMEANVYGEGLKSRDRRKLLTKARRRGDADLVGNGGDDRETVFTIELPDPAKMDAGCKVHIEPHGHRWQGLMAVGAMLGAFKAAQQAANGEVERAAATLEAIQEIVRRTDDKGKDTDGYHNVFLPGGVSLAKALACVEIVEHLCQQGDQEAQAVAEETQQTADCTDLLPSDEDGEDVDWHRIWDAKPTDPGPRIPIPASKMPR